MKHSYSLIFLGGCLALLLGSMLVMSGCLSGMEARSALKEGNNGEAAALFLIALQESPDDPDLLAGLGEAEFNMGLREMGLAKLHQALDMAPTDKDVILAVARTEIENGNLVAAGEALVNYRDIRAPIVEEGIQENGRLLMVKGYEQEALLAMADAALGIYPERDQNLLLWTYYVDTSRVAGDMTPMRKGATAAVIEAINQTPGDPRAVCWERLEGYCLALGCVDGVSLDMAFAMARLMGAGQVVWGELGTGSPMNGHMSKADADVMEQQIEKYAQVAPEQAAQMQSLWDEMKAIEAELKADSDAIRAKYADALETVNADLEANRQAQIEAQASLETEYNLKMEQIRELAAANKTDSAEYKEAVADLCRIDQDREAWGASLSRQERELEQQKAALAKEMGAELYANAQKNHDKSDAWCKKFNQLMAMGKQMEVLINIKNALRDDLGHFLGMGFQAIKDAPEEKVQDLADTSLNTFTNRSEELDGYTKGERQAPGSKFNGAWLEALLKQLANDQAAWDELQKQSNESGY